MSEDLGTTDPREVRSFDDGKPELGADYMDDDFMSPDASTGTAYDTTPAIGGLRDALKKKVTLDLLTLDIPKRPGISIIADPNLINQTKIDMWAKKSKDKKSAGGTNTKRFAEHVLIATVVGLKFHGEEERDESGNALTFVNRSLHSMLGVSHPVLAVDALIGIDGHIVQLGNRIVESAGYEETDFDSEFGMDDSENPTY